MVSAQAAAKGDGREGRRGRVRRRQLEEGLGVKYSRGEYHAGSSAAVITDAFLKPVHWLLDFGVRQRRRVLLRLEIQ